MKIFAYAAVGVFFFPAVINAAPKLSQGYSNAYATAWRDHEVQNQFHYLPKSITSSLEGLLSAYKVIHFGIGEPFYVRMSDGSIKLVSGAVLSGTMQIDLTQVQLDALTEQLKSTYELDTVTLLPVNFTSATVESIIADKVIGFGDAVQSNLPANLAIGQEITFSVGALNSGFAQVVANHTINQGDFPANPTFGFNFTGEIEFVGDPWSAEIRCNARQVWEQVRSKVSASASYGWFSVGSADYENISQDLRRSGACSYNMLAGSLDNEEFGLQIFESVKEMFEQINTLATTGEGFFKFEPNPQAAAPNSRGSGGLFGWGLKVNAGYSSAHFTQDFTLSRTVTYTGRLKRKIPSALTFGVSCSNSTKSFFNDLSDEEPCITAQKARRFQSRVQEEVTWRANMTKDLNNRLLSGSITAEQFALAKKVIDETVFTGDARIALVSSDGSSVEFSSIRENFGPLMENSALEGMNDDSFSIVYEFGAFEEISVEDIIKSVAP